MARREKRLWTDEEKRSICVQRAALGVSVAQTKARTAVTILAPTNGTRWTSDVVCTSWDKIAAKAKVTGLTFHDLRGTAVTGLAFGGCGNAETTTFTGHSLKDEGAILDRIA